MIYILFDDSISVLFAAWQSLTSIPLAAMRVSGGPRDLGAWICSKHCGVQCRIYAIVFMLSYLVLVMLSLHPLPTMPMQKNAFHASLSRPSKALCNASYAYQADQALLEDRLDR